MSPVSNLPTNPAYGEVWSTDSDSSDYTRNRKARSVCTTEEVSRRHPKGGAAVSGCLISAPCWLRRCLLQLHAADHKRAVPPAPTRSPHQKVRGILLPGHPKYRTLECQHNVASSRTVFFNATPPDTDPVPSTPWTYFTVLNPPHPPSTPSCIPSVSFWSDMMPPKYTLLYPPPEYTLLYTFPKVNFFREIVLTYFFCRKIPP